MNIKKFSTILLSCMLILSIFSWKPFGFDFVSPVSASVDVYYLDDCENITTPMWDVEVRVENIEASSATQVYQGSYSSYVDEVVNNFGTQLRWTNDFSGFDNPDNNWTSVFYMYPYDVANDVSGSCIAFDDAGDHWLFGLGWIAYSTGFRFGYKNTLTTFVGYNATVFDVGN